MDEVYGLAIVTAFVLFAGYVLIFVLGNGGSGGGALLVLAIFAGVVLFVGYILLVGL